MRTLIKGGRLVDPSQGLDEARDLLMDKGRIEAILDPSSKVTTGVKVVEAEGCLVVPGLIDMHVHLREPGHEYKETIATGAAAAAAGGFVAVACMANTKPCNDCAAVTDYIIEKAKAAKLVHVYPIGAATAGLLGEGMAEIADLKEHGCVAVSDDGRPIVNAEVARRLLEYCKGFNLLVISHPEDLNLSAGGAMHEGYVSTQLGLQGIPAAAEEVMVARDILLAELTGARLHLAHVSTAGSVRLVREAKARGVAVTCETAPHYFTLTHEAVRDLDYHTSAKMNPPLRTEEDRAAVVQGLRDGAIDAIASDHAPHSSVEKDVEFSLAMNGIVGLETSLGLSLRLVHEGWLNYGQLVERMSCGPARILGIPGGTLKPGSPAHVTVIDPNQEWTVDAAQFKSKSRNSPFQGWKLKGKATQVWVEGKRIL